MCFVLIKEKLKGWDVNTEAKVTTFLFIMIFCINLIFVIYWIFTVISYGMKHLRITPRYSHIYKWMTCNGSIETENNVNKVGLQGAGRLDESENDEDLEKIDMLI